MNAKDIEIAFHEAFFEGYQTVLRGGQSEPYYRYSSTDEPHQIFYRHDYLASALHEVAHWCIAGVKRRKIHDYGYWYLPDGRDPSQQQKFFAAEALPQALEKYFHACIDSDQFHLSLDNLDSDASSLGLDKFSLLVTEQYKKIATGVMPHRAMVFSKKLQEKAR